MEIHREKDGSFPHYAWPGGYRMVYWAKDGGLLCAECANKHGHVADGTDCTSEDAQWRLEGQDVLWEGPDWQCDHCGQTFPTEYGDPDVPDEPQKSEV